jgi:ABC-2 type transport system ATP-binding protein
VSAEPLVRVEGLEVRYGDRPALDGLAFDVDGGEVVGLLGPNGAGKTTTLSVLATLRRPDAGRALIAGHATDRDGAAARRAIGLVPQTLALYPTLTARENLRFFARLLGLARAAARTAVERTLSLVGLDERADDVVATFSGGMQRRLNLACGLLHAPRVLLLDEPTVGVDPQSRERIFTTIRAHAAAGAAVLYSTHYMEEAERLCDRVVLVDHGRTVASGTPVALVRGLGGGFRLEVVTPDPLPPDWLAGVPGAHAEPVLRLVPPARGHRAHVALDRLDTAPRVLERAAAAGGEVLEFHVHQPDLQDVFLELTGRELRD